MNTLLKQRLDEKLEHLSERRFAEVLDFVELLEARERSAVAALSEAHDGDAYLIGAEKTLRWWSTKARTCLILQTPARKTRLGASGKHQAAASACS